MILRQKRARGCATPAYSWEREAPKGLEYGKKRLMKMNFVNWAARHSESKTVGELGAALLFAYHRNDNL